MQEDVRQESACLHVRQIRLASPEREQVGISTYGERSHCVERVRIDLRWDEREDEVGYAANIPMESGQCPECVGSACVAYELM